ncbi:hypothetical protein HMPREF9057_00957 [Actinomyces sp. oral taxon 171 str. F0337]|nr:hypothetical protein HMPREF9057_00957 [Actinomyces sp. oral taxon 171 str. F0337]
MKRMSVSRVRCDCAFQDLCRSVNHPLMNQVRSTGGRAAPTSLVGVARQCF